MPRALTDSSDPRLLKHSPLPISTALTSSLPTGDWTTNYRANYTSPSDSEFVGGAAHSSPQLERRTRVSLAYCVARLSLVHVPLVKKNCVHNFSVYNVGIVCSARGSQSVHVQNKLIGSILMVYHQSPGMSPHAASYC